MTTDDDSQAPLFHVGKTVHTPEGISGKITEVHLDPEGLDHEYTVEWEDGITDRQPETLFREVYDA